MRWDVLVVLLCAVGVGCGGAEEQGNGNCAIEALPLTGPEPGAVTIGSVRLECTADYITPLATASHDDASQLDMVSQTIAIFPDRDCTESPIVVTDDLASGVEESFGETIERSASPELFDEICGSNEWPVRLTFGTQDSFPTTTGVVAATVTN